MRIHLLTFLLFLGYSSFGQLTINPDPVQLNTDISIEDAKVDFVIKNEGSEAQEVWWNLEPMDGPGAWEYQVCDCNLCYIRGFLTAPCSNSCIIEPGGEFLFQVHVWPNAEKGSGNANLQILEACGDTTSSVLEVPISVEVLGSSSTENSEIKSNLSLYPNPAYDYFSIANDSDVEQVAIFNILGKQLKTFKHRAGQTHDISNLDRGYYLIRIVDKYQNDKVLRLTKK